MNIPGTSMENPPAAQELDPTAPPPEAHDDDEGLVETVKIGDQQMAPVSEVIRFRKEARAAKRELDQLRPQIERANAVSQQLEQLQPMLQRISQMTPQQRDALLTGRLPSPEGTSHNSEDVEARQVAEDYGLIAADGSLDIARGRKILDRNAERVQREVQQIVAPMRQTAAQQQAGTLKQQAIGLRAPDGMPLATPESINEAYAFLPPELASQPNVAAVAIGTAMLIDKVKGRKVSAPADYGAPLYSEPTAGRRNGPAITAEERALAAKVGLSDKDLTAAATAITQGGRGVRME